MEDLEAQTVPKRQKQLITASVSNDDELKCIYIYRWSEWIGQYDTIIYHH